MSASDDLSVAVTRIERVRGRTTIPGETGGPAVRVTVRATNIGAEAHQLAAAVVNMYYGPDDTPSSFLLEPGSRLFPDEIPANGWVEGVFVFTLPAEPSVRVRIEADLGHDVSIVSFVGRPQV